MAKPEIHHFDVVLHVPGKLSKRTLRKWLAAAVEEAIISSNDRCNRAQTRPGDSVLRFVETFSIGSKK